MQMKTPPPPNPELQLARDFVQYTHHTIFLTGKAGTGKTTFLRQLKQDTPKRMIVTAPTGVAAINAGGVTLHSFFQLPFGPYVPGSDMPPQRFSKEKINIIKGLDLLVIDEISMVRADVLDAVDAVLRRFKHRHRPFGGVQLLMIGDLHQLAPVIKDDEWQLLAPHYDSCYFFSSHALKQTELISVELTHIYRQSDAHFIDLLNKVRDNRLDATTLKTLNSRYRPGFQPRDDDDYITLTTHNRKADQINERQLQALPSPTLNYAARIDGDYPEYSYPTAQQLTLKKGAQVMFVRNDGSAEKRYFNGKIGKITRLDRERVVVQCPGDAQEITVEPVTWENIKYTLDQKTKEITEDVIGSFTQMPLRLAWAITIHKSQGLTFERAIIDAESAFSHGQVYVALSRCKTFEGMVFSSPLSQNAVKTDATVARFVDDVGRTPPTQEQLTSARVLYQQQLLLECFDFQSLLTHLRYLGKPLRDHGELIQLTADEPLKAIEKQFVDDIILVAEKFNRQLQSLFAPDRVPEEHPPLQERVQRAAAYFTEKLQSGVIPWATRFQFETDNKDIRKQIDKPLTTLRHALAVKTAALQGCINGFFTAPFLNALARAEMDDASPLPVKKQVENVDASNAKHPQLLQTLKAWRAQQAATEQVEHYRILHQRVLVQIAELLPQTPDALLSIKGIGKATVEKYGAPLCELVGDYCREHGVEPAPISPAPIVVKNTHKKDTKKITFELFQQGKSIPDIATTRGLVTSTIEGHLAYFVGLGEIDINALVTKDKIALIKKAVEDVGHDGIGYIKERVGEACSFGEIRLVLESMRLEQVS